VDEQPAVFSFSRARGISFGHVKIIIRRCDIPVHELADMDTHKGELSHTFTVKRLVAHRSFVSGEKGHFGLRYS
jgi:hypothetical protein